MNDPSPLAAATDSLFGQALAHHQQGQLSDAERLYAEIIERDPQHFAALNFLGVIAHQKKDYRRATDLIGRAIDIEPAQAGMHSNLALAQNELGLMREAIESCDRAIALDPACVEAHSNRGNSLWGLGRHDEAFVSYANALAIDPDHAQTHWNEGFLRLQLGQFEAGWPKLEWRWQLAHVSAFRRSFTEPLWLGRETLAGRTILLHAEQGLGDTILLCRYAKLVAALGANVVLEVQRPLAGLLAGLDGVSQLVVRGEPLPRFDCHCPLLSLPLAFNTTLQTFPAGPAYLRCTPDALAHWRTLLGPATRPRVGLVWQGTETRRNVPLAQMLQLVTPDAQFFSLQKDVTPADQALLDARPGLMQSGTDLRNFADAPLVALMDVVITVDTSMAHLAGALGRPVWILLARNPDWRWMLERDDSPWYPGARLFRQTTEGDWSGALARIATALSALTVQSPEGPFSSTTLPSGSVT